jgi:polyhydroxyalkanoate synthesis regulator phasin
VEAGTRSDVFLDALALGWRLRGRLQREAERQSRRALHLLNLPTASDVRRLSEQVGALQRQVRELSREVEK